MRIRFIALLLLAFTPAAFAADSSTFSGQISDSICAREGSHADFQQVSKDMGKTARECTLACVDRLSAKFVLFDPKKKKIYDLSDQAQARKFAGKMVQVTGTLKKNEILVKTISPE